MGEYLNGVTNTGSQHYLYDRWGNRRIDPATWGTGINNKQFDVDPANNRLGVPGGQSGMMSYDSAGNLATDSYSGMGNRWYDAENRMISAQGGAQGNYQSYNYNERREKRGSGLRFCDSGTSNGKFGATSAYGCIRTAKTLASSKAITASNYG